MEIAGYKPRVIDERLDMYLRTFGAVCVEGPKWCGKTWTSRTHSASEFLVASPAKNFQNRKLLEIDINAAFAGAAPHLIDEWQEFPELWDATRAYVDESNEKGRYILTGSSTPKRKGVMHSGTGRIASLRMRPMTLWESGESDGLVSFRDLCENRLEGVVQGRTPGLKEIAEWIVRGGWPESIGVPIRDALSIPREYIKQVENNDIHRIDETRRDVHKVDMLLRSLARNEATTASLSTLCNDMTEYDAESVDPDTVSSYLNALSRLFVIDNQKPFHTNVRSKVRIKQSEKRHLCDPSIAAALLKMTPEKVVGDIQYMGFLFESLVERDLAVYAECMGAELMHYQDYLNREVDAVVEMEDGEWVAIEIKLGARQEDAAAKGLIDLRDALAAEKFGKPPKALIVILGHSGAAYRRKDGVLVCPISMLKA